MSVPDRGRRAFLVSVIVLIVMGAVFFLFGMFMLRSYGDSKRCTEPVRATVVEVERRRSADADDYRGTREVYAPVFRYEHEGETYTVKSTVATYPPEYSVGDTTTIKIDPNDPEKIYYSPGETSVVLCMVFRIVGGVLMTVGLVLLVKRLVKKGSVTPKFKTPFDQQ